MEKTKISLGLLGDLGQYCSFTAQQNNFQTAIIDALTQRCRLLEIVSIIYDNAEEGESDFWEARFDLADPVGKELLTSIFSKGCDLVKILLGKTVRTNTSVLISGLSDNTNITIMSKFNPNLFYLKLCLLNDEGDVGICAGVKDKPQHMFGKEFDLVSNWDGKIIDCSFDENDDEFKIVPTNKFQERTSWQGYPWLCRYFAEEYMYSEGGLVPTSLKRMYQSWKTHFQKMNEFYSNLLDITRFIENDEALRDFITNYGIENRYACKTNLVQHYNDLIRLYQEDNQLTQGLKSLIDRLEVPDS